MQAPNVAFRPSGRSGGNQHVPILQYRTEAPSAKRTLAQNALKGCFPPISTNAALNTKVAQEFSAGSGHNVRKPCINSGPKCPLFFRNGRNLAHPTGFEPVTSAFGGLGPKVSEDRGGFMGIPNPLKLLIFNF